ncbi:Probable RNA-directed DNA polymerase from transposon BS [Eumeta japonica]|uniref:Probable RNA-directed DNA polymerase from transposon BS n=1 Tax=Eumeta variegata TaxID=151549 RepID=A0A4C1X9M7_EUMVA|nr:Probable RNA-directed DNA polymerase from transposon BS [Eumeta japonica]
MSENSIDIALVQETYLKPNRPKACSIAGYVQLRTDRTYSSKGYRSVLQTLPTLRPINIPPLTNMEATGCRLAMTGHSTLVIVSVYLPSPKRCSYQPRQDSGRGERAGGSGILGSPEVSARYSRIDKSKKRSFAPRERISHSRVQIQSASSPTRSESSRSGIRNESWSDLMEEIKPSHKAFWAVTKALKTEDIPYTPLKNLIIQAIDDAEIAECLADSIETQCSHASLRTTSLISVASRKRFSKTSLEPKDDLAPVSLSEVQTLVKSLNTRKAPGLDGISNKAIKCFSIPLLSLLVAIFNACIKNCYFPPAWKEAEVIGIHKPGKPRDLPASYRPISLLSGLGKLFEKILKTRLSDHLLGKGLIIDEQFGFRPAHSCPQQVLRLVEYVSEGFETERSTVAVFFDVAKAFDRQTDISHLGMSALTRQDVLSEQEFLKAPPSLLCCTPRTQTMYRDRRRLASNSRYSRTIPRSFTEIGIGAPDSPSSPLQRAIDELGQWFRKWRIEVNPDKSAAIQFKYGKIRSRLIVDKNTPNLKMLDAIIPWQRNYKYLGVTLDKKSTLPRSYRAC